jgi:hypothetical protein
LQRTANQATNRLVCGQMDAHELRAKALHYRRIAALVSGEVAEALLELAADYASLADKLEESEPTPEAAKQSSQQCPSEE